MNYVFHDIDEFPIDYVDIAYESCLSDMQDYNKFNYYLLSEQSKYVMDCLNEGYIGVFEASNKTKAIWDTISKKIKEFFEMLSANFRKKAIEMNKKYVAWLDDNGVEAEILERSKLASKTLSPYWKGDYVKGHDTIKSAIVSAFNKYNLGKYDDYTWGNDLGVKSADDIKDADLNAKLKALFKFGSIDEIKVKQVTVVKDELAEITKKAITYVRGYDKNCPSRIDSLTKLYISNADRAKPPSIDSSPKPTQTASTTESVDPYQQYLDIEQRYIYETELVDLPYHSNNENVILNGLINTLDDLYQSVLRLKVYCDEDALSITTGRCIDEIETGVVICMTITIDDYQCNKHIMAKLSSIKSELIDCKNIFEDMIDNTKSENSIVTLRWRYNSINNIINRISNYCTDNMQELYSAALTSTTESYHPVLEDDNASDKDKPAKQEAVDDEGNKVSDKTVSSAEGDATNPDKVDKTTTSDTAAKTYLENCNAFFKLAISAYSTACEERFITYINLLKAIGDKSGESPKFDDKGVYIPRKDRANTKEKEKPNDSNKTTEDTTSNVNVS